MSSGDHAAGAADLADPITARGHASLGLCLAALGQSREAVMHMEAALALDPNMSAARIALSSIWRDIGSPDGDISQMMTPLDEVLAVDPSHLEARQVT